MFCPKCGTQLPDGATFCPECGARVSESTAIPPQANGNEAVQPAPAGSGTQKKSGKNWKWLFLLIPAIIIIFVVAFIIYAANQDDETVFTMAEKLAPYEAAGIDATYGDLIDWMMTDKVTSFEDNGNTVYVQYDGTVNGGSAPVEVVLVLSDLDKDYYRVRPYTMTLNGIDVPDFDNPDEMLSALFSALSEKETYPTFNDFIESNIEGGYTGFDRYFDHSSGGSDGAEDGSADTPEDDYVSIALDKYLQIVEQAPDQFDPDEYMPPSGNYFYALIQMEPDDPVPTLLLEEESDTGLYYVRVFQYDPINDTMIIPEEILMEGVTSAGGYRGGISLEKDGYGIRNLEDSSGMGTTTISRVTLVGGSLIYEQQWTGTFDDEIPDEFDDIAIEWYEYTDTSAFGQ